MPFVADGNERHRTGLAERTMFRQRPYSGEGFALAAIGRVSEDSRRPALPSEHANQRHEL